MAKQKEEPQDEPKAASALSGDPKIEAVKQLIFGENMQQYDSEFSEVRATIKKTKQELVNEIDETRDALTNLINETRESLTKAVSDLRSDTNKKISQLREDMDESIADLDDRKLNRKLLGALLQEMGKQIAEQPNSEWSKVLPLINLERSFWNKTRRKGKSLLKNLMTLMTS